jgi:hypothetical protein
MHGKYWENLARLNVLFFPNLALRNSFIELEIAVEELRSCNSPGIVQIPAR